MTADDGLFARTIDAHYNPVDVGIKKKLQMLLPGGRERVLSEIDPSNNPDSRLYLPVNGKKEVPRAILAHELGHHRSAKEHDALNEWVDKINETGSGLWRDPKETSRYKEEVRAWDHAEDLLSEKGEALDSREGDMRSGALKTYETFIEGEQRGKKALLGLGGAYLLGSLLNARR